MQILNKKHLEMGTQLLFNQIRVLYCTIFLSLVFVFSSCKKEKPIAEFSFTPGTCDAPCDIAFINQSEDADQYLWDFGDNGRSTETDPVHTFIDPGIYVVELEASNEHGTSTAIKEITIGDGSGGGTVNTDPNAPVANFEYSPNDCTAPCLVSFTNTSTNADTYLWNFGDEEISTAANPQHSYTVDATYLVTLIAKKGTVESPPKTKWIKIGDVVSTPPVAQFNSSTTSCEAPCNVTFTNNSTNATEFSWTFGDGQSSNATSPSHTFTTADTYNVVLTATGPGGSSTANQTITVVDGDDPCDDPTADFDIDNDGCEAPCTVYFEENADDADSYFWDFGDGQTSTSPNPSHTYTEAGEYDVSLTVTNACGSDTYYDYVTVEEGFTGFTTATVTRVILYDIYNPYGYWDYEDWPDIYYAFANGNNVVNALSGNTILTAAPAIFPLYWTFPGGNNEIPNNSATYHLAFGDDDSPYGTTLMGTSLSFRIQDFIDNDYYPNSIDVSYEFVNAVIELEWE